MELRKHEAYAICVKAILHNDPALHICCSPAFLSVLESGCIGLGPNLEFEAQAFGLV